MVSQRHSHPATARLRTAREGISHIALGSKPEDSVGAEIRILIADDFDDWRIRTRDILRQQKD